MNVGSIRKIKCKFQNLISFDQIFNEGNGRCWCSEIPMSTYYELRQILVLQLFSFVPLIIYFKGVWLQQSLL